jgi:hypothetical protein
MKAPGLHDWAVRFNTGKYDWQTKEDLLKYGL